MPSMDILYYGAAIFSTHLGRFEARNTLPPSIMLRSNPDDDQDDMVAKLQSTFPQQCKAITAPITNIYDYFDPYDTHRHGYRFLESVLGTIAHHNFIRAGRVQSFAEQWINANPYLFEGIMSMTQGDFTEAEHHTYGCDFLGEAFCLIQGLRMNRPAALLVDQPAITTPPMPLAYYPQTPTLWAPHADPSTTRTLWSPNDQSSPPAPTSGRRLGTNFGRRVTTSSSQSHGRGTSPQSSSSHVAPQPGSKYIRKSRVNSPPSRSHAHRSSQQSPSSQMAVQSNSNIRKSRVNTSSSQSHARGTSQNHARGTSQNHAYGASQSHAYGTYQQSPSSYVALQPGSYVRQPANQRAKYESLQQPGRAHFPARRDFHSDPEDYIRMAQKQAAGPIIATPPPGQSGPFLYQYLSPNHRVIPWPPRLSDPVTVQNPVKTVSDDARVLEMQEAASRRIHNDSNNLGASLRQPSANAFGKLPDPELHNSALPGSSSHISYQQPASYILDRDPAVISVGFKPSHTLNQNDHHPADVRQRPHPEKEGSLASLIENHQSLDQQTSTPVVSEITETDSLAGSHVANEHQTYQKYDNVKTPPDANEPPTHGAQSEGEESSSHGRESFTQNMTSDVQDYPTTRSSSLHGNIDFSNTSPTSLQGNYYRNRPGTSHSDEKDTVWVGGLYPELTEAKVAQIFEPYGEITRVSKVFTRDGETRKAFAFVTFLTEKAAARAIDGLNFRKYEDITLRVRYAWQINKYGDAIHRISPLESKFESLNQLKAISLTENVSPSESRGRDITSPSLGRKYGDSSKESPSKKATYVLKSNRQGAKAIKTPNTVSGSNPRPSRKLSFPGVQNGNVTTDPQEINESAEGTATIEQEVKIAEDSPELSESLRDSSTIEQEVNIAKDSSGSSESLRDSSTIEQEVILDVPEQRKSTKPEQGIITLADAPVLDSSIKDPGQKLPQKMSQTDGVPATEPQAIQDTNVSSSSLVPVDTSALQPLSDTKDSDRLSHKVRWKLLQRAIKAAKQKEILEKDEQRKLGAMSQGVGFLTETSGESIALDVETGITNLSVSETIPGDIAEQQIKLETDLQSSVVENPQAESIGHIKGGLQLTQATGSEATADILALRTRHLDDLVAPPSLTEQSVDLRNQVRLASKAVDAPETLPTSVNKSLSADLPSLLGQVEMDGAEAPSLSWTQVTTHKKRKILTPVKNNVETASKPEPNPSVIQKATEYEILLDQVDEECATDSVGRRDGNPETTIEEDAIERICEPTAPLRTESVTPTQDHPVSTTSRPTKTKSKKSRKSKGKGKAKSAKGSSKTPAVPSEELPETSASYIRSLPEPETPFLVDKTHNIPPIELDKKERGHKNTMSSSAREERHICSRRELTQYHHLKDKDYWPQLSKVIREPTIPDPSSFTIPMPEKFQDVEAGEPGVSHSQSMASGEASPPASESGSSKSKRRRISKTADNDSNSVTPEAVARAEQVLQTCAELAHPSSSTVAEPKPFEFSTVPHYQFSAASTIEASLPDPRAINENSKVFGFSLICQPDADSGSPPKPILASSDVGPSDWCSKSKTPPLTPQTPCTRTCTDSSSSPGTLTDDESSESSNVQSGDDLVDNGGEEHAAPSSPPRMATSTIYPFHVAGVPSRSSVLQPGDVVEVATNADGEKKLMKVVRDTEPRKITEVDGEERDSVERRDTSVVVEKEEWGHLGKVWIV